MVLGAAAIDIELYSLFQRRGRPVVPVVKGLHVEVRLYSGLLHGHRHLHGMSADARKQAVTFGELDGRAEQVRAATLDEAVPHAALHVGADRPVVDGPLNVAGHVVDLGMDLCNPPDSPPALLPVLVQIARG